MIDRVRTMYEVIANATEAHLLGAASSRASSCGSNSTRRACSSSSRLPARAGILCGRPFEERLEAAQRAFRLSEELADDDDLELERRIQETDTIVFAQDELTIVPRVKKFVERWHAARLWADSASWTHRADGLVLQRAASTYRSGAASDGSVYKWKPWSTVDLCGPRLSTSSGPLPPTLFGNALVLDAESRIVSSRDEIVEYLVVHDVGASQLRLFGLRFRPDRTRANALSVVKATVREAMQPIEVGELAAEAP